MNLFSSILMLHHVSDDKKFSSLQPYVVSRKSFLRLLDFISAMNIETVTFRDFASISDFHTLGRNRIVLTFDDCPRHLLDFAVPELQKRNMRAVFYAPTAFLGQVNAWDVAEGKASVELMNASELVALHQLGMEIGSHSHTHERLAKVHDKEALEQQFKLSKQILDNLLPEKVISFAYPYGSVPQNHTSFMENAGYQFGCSIFYPRIDRYALRRIIFHDGDSRRNLLLKHSYFYHLYRSWNDRRIIGKS